MGQYPLNPRSGFERYVQSWVPGLLLSRLFPARFTVAVGDAPVASTTGVHAAVTDNGSPQTITTGITNPATPRVLTATAGGTAGDIKAIQVVVNGTNYLDEEISETLPAFTENSAGTVTGTKAFKTVTSYTIPAHDGTGATTALGFSDKLGLPVCLTENTVVCAHLGGVREGTAPTVTVDADEIEKNTVDLNSALDVTKAVDIDFLIKAA